MGVVYRCHDPKLHRSVAIKVVLDSTRADAELLARFLREGHALAKLNKRGIVAVHEVGEHEGCPFLVMEFVEGETFEALLKRERVSPRRIAQIVRDMGYALHHAHKAGLTHRDVKPQNVMVDGQGHAQLMDFGLARDSFASQQLTETGEIMGTPAYMAPEQVDPSPGGHGSWTDVYALGAVLYRALADRPVFTAGTPVALLKKVLLDEPEPLSRLEPAVPADLAIIAHRCLEKDPLRRYSSAAEVATELERFIFQEPIVAQPIGARERALRWLRQNPQLSVAGLLCLVAVVAALFALFGSAQESADSQAGARSRRSDLGQAEQGRAAAGQREALEAARDLAQRRVLEMEKNPTLKQLVLAQKALLAFEKAADAAPPASPARRDVSLLRETMESAVLRQVFGMLESAQDPGLESVLQRPFNEKGSMHDLNESVSLLYQLGEDLQSSPARKIPLLLISHQKRLLEGDRRPGIDESKRQSEEKKRDVLRRRLLQAARTCLLVRRRLGEPEPGKEQLQIKDIDAALAELAGSEAGETPSEAPR